MLGGHNAAPSETMSEARKRENQLAEALMAGGESNGVIGRDAGPRLQRLPSSVYWAGLGAWGIRLFPGSIDSYFTSLRSLRPARTVRNDEDAASAPQAPQLWSPALPPHPRTCSTAQSFA